MFFVLPGIKDWPRGQYLPSRRDFHHLVLANKLIGIIMSIMSLTKLRRRRDPRPEGEPLLWLGDLESMECQGSRSSSDGNPGRAAGKPAQ